jgi:hypothetical protein
MIKTFMKRISILISTFLISSVAFSSSEQTSLKNENVWKADITVFNTTGYTMRKSRESIDGGVWTPKFLNTIEPFEKNLARAEPHWFAKGLVMQVEWTLHDITGQAGICTISVKNEIRNSATSDIKCMPRPPHELYPSKRIRNTRIIGTNEFDFVISTRQSADR